MTDGCETTRLGDREAGGGKKKWEGKRRKCTEYNSGYVYSVGCTIFAGCLSEG